MTLVRLPCAAAAKVFFAVVGEPLPRSFDGVAVSIIVGIGDLAGLSGDPHGSPTMLTRVTSKLAEGRGYFERWNRHG